MVQPLYRWQLPAAVSVDRATRDHAVARGVSLRLLALLVRRGVTGAADIDGFLAPPLEGLHDPGLLPDADAALRRVASARARSERVMVYGDFDADGLTGLSILTIALRRLGLDVEPYVPERIGDGHGLSLRAVERAVAEGRSLIVTADCGTSSESEIAFAAARGVEVVVTDHHHAAIVPGSAVAVVNPQRVDGSYPERRLTGAGVAWKVAHLLLGGDATPPGSLPDAVAALADLALIGTVADVAPVFGENRSIARLGLDRLRTQPRPGLAALMEQAGVARDRLDLEDVAFALAPRLNAAGRVGEAARAARLLLTEDEEEARSLATEIDAANRERRDMTRKAIAEARRLLGLVRPGEEPEQAAAPEAAAAATAEAPGVEALAAVEDPVGPDDLSGPPIPVPPRSAADLPAALLIRGEWPVGIVGLVAGRLAEDLGRPAVVATTLDGAQGILRASCRSGGAFNMAEALVACSDLLIRHGGHQAAAGFDISAENWPRFAERFLEIAAAQLPPAEAPELRLDLVLPADSVDFDFVREMTLLEPTGPGNPRPTIGIAGLSVSRVRPAAGGHTQLVLRRSKDVLDAIAFRRADLAESLHEGDRIDVVARAASRRFGGFETIQLEVIDVSEEGARLKPGRGAGAEG